jgi:hypothetical protein
VKEMHPVLSSLCASVGLVYGSSRCNSSWGTGDWDPPCPATGSVLHCMTAMSGKCAEHCLACAEAALRAAARVSESAPGRRGSRHGLTACQ